MEKRKQLHDLPGESKITNINDIVPELVKELSNRLDKIYLVGGTLRDVQFGNVPFDFDFVVSSLETVKEFLSSKGIKFFILKNGKFPFLRAVRNFGTFDFMEIYGGNIEKDKNRRDFTINTLYYDVKAAKFIKDELALSDIKNGILRVVHEKSIENDPIRALRAVRFIAKFHLVVEKCTLPLITEGFDLLKNAKPERKNEEMRRILPLPDSSVLNAFGLVFGKDISDIAEKLALCEEFPLLLSEVSKGVSYRGLCGIYLISKELSLNRVCVFGLTKKEENFTNVIESASCDFETLFEIFIKRGIYPALASALLYCSVETAKRVEKWKDIKIDGTTLEKKYHISGEALGKLKVEKLKEECKRIYESL